MTKVWKEHYWFGVPCTKARVNEIVRMARPEQGAQVTVLEAGCNEGFLSQALIESGCNVTSVDNNPKMIKSAMLQFGIEVIQADINKLPFADESFDIAIGGEVLEHIDNPGIGLSELFRVSREHVIISLPLGPYWLGEKTHKWQIEGINVEHDNGILTHLDKTIIILEFIKRGAIDEII